jgi:hypothetical protein
MQPFGTGRCGDTLRSEGDRAFRKREKPICATPAVYNKFHVHSAYTHDGNFTARGRGQFKPVGYNFAVFYRHLYFHISCGGGIHTYLQAEKEVNKCPPLSPRFLYLFSFTPVLKG